MAKETERDDQIGAFIAEYLKAEAGGSQPDREILLQKYPEFADELTAFFADHDAVRGMAERMGNAFATQDDSPDLPDSAATIDPVNPVEAATIAPQGTKSDLGATVSSEIPGYDIIQELGRGGMGVVYKARQTELGRIVALKMILSGGHASESDLARFVSEAQAVAQLQHPNVVQLFESGQHNGLPYFTLEYVEGGSLAEKLDGVPMPPKEAAHLVEQLARGVQAAHERGIVHRDLKPANVLLQSSRHAPRDEHHAERDDYTPKITDFGLAKRVEGGSGVTATGAIMGTPSYMAPEQASGDGKHVGPAADVYALGAILYECLTGRPPFRAATPIDTIMQVVADDPVPPSHLQSKTPRDLETICLKCLQKEPEKRYASAEALADDLTRFLRGETIRARPVGAVERTVKWVKRKPAAAALMFTVTLILLGIGIGGPIIAVHQMSLRRTADEALANEKTSRLEAQRQTHRANTALYAMQLESTLRGQRDGRIGEAAMLLEKTDTKLRDWEYLWLHRLCATQTIPMRGGPADCFAFSPDGSSLVTVRELSQKEARSLVGKWRQGRPGRFSEVIVWNLQTVTAGARFNIPGTLANGFQPVTFGSNDRIALPIRSFDAKSKKYFDAVKIFSAKDGAEIAELRGPIGRLSSLTFSDDGDWVAAGYSRSVVAWNVSTKQKLHFMDKKMGYVVTYVCFSHDGKKLARAHGPFVNVWDAKSGKQLHALEADDGTVHGLAFSPDNRYLAAAGANVVQRKITGGKLFVWNLTNDAPVFRHTAHDRPIRRVAFGSDGRHLQTAAFDGRVIDWDLKERRPSATLVGPFLSPRFVAFSPDGTRAACSTKWFYEKTNGSVIHPLRIWQTQREPEYKTLVAKGPVSSIAFDARGRNLVYGTALQKGFGAPRDAGTVELYDLKNRSSRLLVQDDNPISWVAMSPDGSLVTAAVNARTFRRGKDRKQQPAFVRIWSTSTGKLLHTLSTGMTYIRAFSFSPNGNDLAVLGYRYVGKGRDMRHVQEIWKCDAETGRHASIAIPICGDMRYSPDGKWLVRSCNKIT